MNALKILFMSLSVAYLFIGCSKDEESFMGNVYGKITDAATNEPLKGVAVTITPGGRSTVTGNDGSFEFIDVEPQQYTMQAQKSGYHSNYKQIRIQSGQIALGDMTLSKVQTSSLIEVTPTTLNFGKSTSELTFDVMNRGTSGTLEWNINGINVTWIKVSPMSGTTGMGKTSKVKVIVDRTELTQDESTIITVNAAGGSASVQITAKFKGEGGEISGDDDDPNISEKITNGLFAYYTFENEIKDQTETGMTAIALESSFVDSFNGTKALKIPAKESAYISIPDGLIDQREMSISFWAKDLSDGHLFHVVRKESNDVAFCLAMKGGFLKFVATNYDLNYQYENMPSFVHNSISNGWHMITLISDFNITTFATITTRLYVDGVFTDQVTESNNPYTESSGMMNDRNYDRGLKFIMGGNWGTMPASPLTIDNLRVYKSRMLSGDEVKQIFKYENK